MFIFGVNNGDSSRPVLQRSMYRYQKGGWNSMSAGNYLDLRVALGSALLERL